MSHEFLAPSVTPTEDRARSAARIEVTGTILRYQEKAQEVYGRAIQIAESVDDKMGTVISFNRNAVVAASLLAMACVRGAEIS